MLLLPSAMHFAVMQPAGLHRGVIDSQKPFCIGVAGATASGKSSVVAKVIERVASRHVAAITQDCFYRNLSPEERAQADASDYNFDHPNAFDFDHQIQELRAGARDVSVPTYDFRTHSRLGSDHDQHIHQPQIVIFEGILALHDPRLRSLFDMKIFVDVEADVRLARRIRRDMASRGRDLSGILQQYEQFVKPSTETFVLPTKAHADVIVPRGAENTVAIDVIARHINSLLAPTSPDEGDRSGSERHILQGVLH
jgi:uridine kinase